MKTASIFSMLIVTVVLMASAQMALGYTVTTTGPGGYGIYQTGSGGEFTLQPDPMFAPLVFDNYASVAINQGSTSNTFQTFCLEGGENISVNTTYTAVLNTDAVKGGATPPATSDPISQGTAWLYFNFAKGTLDNYNYTGDRHTSAGLLQNAIWWLEGEEGKQYDATNPFMSAVVAQFNNSATTAMADNYASGNANLPVLALNLYDANGGLAQDQLVLTPTPIPAAAWLLVSGLLGLVGVRRRMSV